MYIGQRYWTSGIGVLAIVCLVWPAAAFDFFEPVQPLRPFQVMAHRGAKDQAPENTAPALERCIDDRIEWAEVDVRLTKDGAHIIFHDGEVDGKTDGTGTVRDLTLAEVKAHDACSLFDPQFAGQRILTLTECLALCRNRINLYLDCKDIDPVLLVKEVLDAGMERQVVAFDALEVLATIQQRSGDRIAIMPKWHPEFGTEAWVAKWRPDAVEINVDEVTPGVCAWFHEKGIKVQAKVLGDDDLPEVWVRARKAGVDWFQTDRAAEVIDVLEKEDGHVSAPGLLASRDLLPGNRTGVQPCELFRNVYVPRPCCACCSPRLPSPHGSPMKFAC